MYVKQNMSVETDMDRVVLAVSKTRFSLPYAQATRIAASVRNAATYAMRVVKEPLKNRKTFIEPEIELQVNEVSPVLRNTLTPTREWKVVLLGEDVIIRLGNTEIKIHFSDAFQIAYWLRLGVQQAKAWAGDTRRQMTVTGHLTNAEENYKLGLN